MCDEIFGDGGYACVETMLKMSEGLQIQILLLRMYMAQSVRMFAKSGEIFGFFGLMGAEQAHTYQ